MRDSGIAIRDSGSALESLLAQNVGLWPLGDGRQADKRTAASLRIAVGQKGMEDCEVSCLQCCVPAAYLFLDIGIEWGAVIRRARELNNVECFVTDHL